MKVCVKCRREMRCKTNGVICHYGGGHCYPGDLFRCDKCGAQVIVTNASSSFFSGDQLKRSEVVEMER